jgi:3-deoxy-D-manno-octulosonic-acid transferase
VLARVARARSADPVLAPGSAALVAGSTWPADEEVLLAAFVTVLARRPDARLILAPHEPTPDAIELILRTAGRLGAPSPRLLGEATARTPLVVVDRLGVLATLYGAGTLAYVGGGFGRAGLHSVLEPAAWGLPVIVGPHWQESRDAGRLISGGAAVSAGTVEALATAWLNWLQDEPARAAAGARALGVVEAERGASARSAALLDEVL